jgi:hypothetical protein
MKKHYIYLFITKFLLLMFLLVENNLFGQGAAINETGTNADPSAILDVSSTNKGLLMPRMTESERDAIQSPAIGLMIFNTTSNCFNFWNGLTWKQSCFDCAFNAPYVSSNSPVCEGDDIHLNSSTLPGAVYNWTGPNGFTSNLQNPIISNSTLANAGQYSLTITKDNCTSNAVTTFVTVKLRPQLPVITSNSPLCEGDTLKLSVLNVPGGIYSWTGPNGFTSSLQNISIENATSSINAGVYDLVITVNGCNSEIANENIVINTIPQSPIISSNSPVCVGNTLTIAASAINGATYNWTGPNGFTSTDQSINITDVTLVNQGVYEVTAYVNGCANAPASINTVVNTATNGNISFNYTGADQEFIVPLCITNLNVKVWGAGGGGYSSDKGGGGGFSEADLSVTPGDTLKIMVGSGGRGICSGECSGQSCTGVYGGGGGTYEGNGGGGMSGIFAGSIPLIIAGGGGGGGGGGNNSPAGAGGGLSGSAALDVSYGGKGGTQSAGGAGGASTMAPYPGSGSYLQGATSNLGGAGGGGYYGGGGGGRAGHWLHRGGGGGSGYIDPTFTSNSQLLSGTNETPANTSDPDYVGGVGNGGTNGNGGNGYVVIYW